MGSKPTAPNASAMFLSRINVIAFLSNEKSRFRGERTDTSARLPRLNFFVIDIFFFQLVKEKKKLQTNAFIATE